MGHEKSSPYEHAIGERFLGSAENDGSAFLPRQSHKARGEAAERQQKQVQQGAGTHESQREGRGVLKLFLGG